MLERPDLSYAVWQWRMPVAAGSPGLRQLTDIGTRRSGMDLFARTPFGIRERFKTMLERRSSYEYEDLLACGRGELFGAGNAQLPLPPMLMFDRITRNR